MLPSVPPYPLPDLADLPANKVDWTVEAPRAALLIHDMQQYFIDAYGPDSPLIDTVVANIRQVRDAADQRGIPVFYTAQPPNQDPEDRGLQRHFWGPGMQDDGRDRIIADLSPRAQDTVLTKWRYDAFSRTDLEERLASDGRDQLLIAGVYAHIGCLTTATSAFMRDVEPFLVVDALADFSPEEHRAALAYAAGRCGVVADTAGVVGALTGDQAPLTTAAR